jgi:histone H3/H4
MENRHRRILRDNIYGITSPVLKRIIHEVKICNVSYDVFNIMRLMGRDFLENKMEEMYEKQDKNHHVLCKEDLEKHDIFFSGMYDYDKIRLPFVSFDRVARELIQDIVIDYNIDKQGCERLRKYFIDYLFVIAKKAIKNMEAEHTGLLKKHHFKN